MVESHRELIEIKNMRVTEKYKAWLKRGEEEFAHLIPSRVLLELSMIEI